MQLGQDHGSIGIVEVDQAKTECRAIKADLDCTEGAAIGGQHLDRGNAALYLRNHLANPNTPLLENRTLPNNPPASLPLTT